MPWQQLSLQTTQQYVDALASLLEASDAQAISLLDAADQPLLEPGVGEMPLWEKVTINALFSADFATQPVIDFLQQQLGENIVTDYQITLIADQDWERAWLDNFKPMQFGSRLWIIPSAYEPPDPTAVNILLDPGLAFGTGTHPTTALCLQWLDENDITDKTVIDYGCGSGILAIAALKLGARYAYAIDYDPQALDATLDNAKRNQIDLSKLIIILPEQFTKIKADIILANILAQPLIELAPKFANLLKPTGNIVLSGILQEQAAAVSKAYQAGFKSLSTQSQEDWVRLTGTKT